MRGESWSSQTVVTKLLQGEGCLGTGPLGVEREQVTLQEEASVGRAVPACLLLCLPYAKPLLGLNILFASQEHGMCLG